MIWIIGALWVCAMGLTLAFIHAATSKPTPPHPSLAARTSGNRSTTEAHPGTVSALGPSQQTGVGLPEQPTHDPTTCPECIWGDR